MTSSISDGEIEKARRVLADHTVKRADHESALECLLWCIASQALGWEPASRFVYTLRRLSRPDDSKATLIVSKRDVLSDNGKVYQASIEAHLRFAKGRRFESAIDYFGSLKGEWWGNIVNANPDDRVHYVDNVKWVGEKTFSFYHICMGGVNLLALDVHVMRGLNRLGIELDENYVIPRARSTDAQKVRKTPDRKDYIRIESEARELFSGDERFKVNGKVDMALADAVLWWRGASRGDSDQGYLFDGGLRSGAMPYSIGFSSVS